VLFANSLQHRRDQRRLAIAAGRDHQYALTAAQIADEFRNFGFAIGEVLASSYVAEAEWVARGLIRSA
jgi:hypothetical protein